MKLTMKLGPLSKIKMSRTSLFLIAGGVFLIAVVGVGTIYFQQADRQSELEDKLIQAQANLSNMSLAELSSQQEELEGQSDQTNAQLEAVRAVLSEPVGIAGATSTLFDIAGDTGVEIIEMTSSGPAGVSLEGVDCLITSLMARIEGDLPRLMDFIKQLNNYLLTGVIRSVEIEIPDRASGQETSAEIHFAIYTYGGN
jgi:uncharacterized protein YqgV (UPF0045/DUF77 family)